MSRPIEAYALLADGRSAALLSRDGTIDCSAGRASIVSLFRGAAQAVRRSLLMLNALIYRPSGAMVAALTTSLPEVTWRQPEL